MRTTASDARSWLKTFLSDRHLRLCAILTVFVALMPPHGIPELDLCFYKRLTNAPCPGCGITRSGSNLLRCQPEAAFEYNPFGLILMPIIFVLGGLAFLRREWRDAIRERLLPWSCALRRAYLGTIIAFVAFGLTRWFLVWMGWLKFPTPWLTMTQL